MGSNLANISLSSRTSYVVWPAKQLTQMGDQMFASSPCQLIPHLRLTPRAG